MAYPDQFAVENNPDLSLQAQFNIVRSMLSGTSVGIPDIRQLVCMINNPNRDYKFTLDYADASYAPQDLKDYQDLTFHRQKRFSRILQARNRYLAWETTTLLPGTNMIPELETMTMTAYRSNALTILKDFLTDIMGKAKQQADDFMPIEGSTAGATIVEKTRAEDGWIDLKMSGTDTIDMLTEETSPSKFTALLKMFAKRQSKDLNSLSNPGMGDIALWDKDFFVQYQDSLIYRGGYANTLINRDMYGPLNARVHDSSMPEGDFTTQRIADRTWTMAMYGDRDAQGTPSVFFDFLENDPVNSGYSLYPVMFAACRNTWYSMYNAWQFAFSEPKEPLQPHTQTLRMGWQCGTTRMPGATQGAFWGRIRNSTLLQQNPSLNLFKLETNGMNPDDIDKFYVDGGEKERGAQYRKAWTETSKVMAEYPNSDIRENFLKSEKNRGTTNLNKQKESI